MSSRRDSLRRRGEGWLISDHALLRMQEMGVDRQQVESVLEEPEVTYPCQQGRRIAKRGQLAVCFWRDVIVTVLWNTCEPYERASGTAG